MVYIYALIGRLIVYPYFMHKGGQLLSDRRCRLFYWWLLVEFSLSTLGVLLHNYVMHPLMSLLMTVSIFIFFSSGYVMAWLLLVDLCRYLCRRLGIAISARLSHTIDRLSVGLAVPLFFASLFWGYWNVATPRVVHRQLILSGGMDTAHTNERLRLALLTDLHIGEGITQSYVDRAVELTLEHKPDVVLVGGDYIDHFSRYAFTPEVMAAMRRLSTVSDGAYYVPGNHEYRADSVEKLNWVKRVGGVLLVDSIAYPRGGAYAIIGRDDYVRRSRRASLGSLLARLEPKGLNILLEHTPEHLDSLAGTPIDLALYGHTHGGQVFPNQLSVWLKYGIASGARRVGQTEAYVSSGVGAAGAPYRIGTRSEIVIYDIYYNR